MQVATTAADGTYVLRGLPAGTYDLRISAMGFDSTEVRDIPLGASVVYVPSVLLEVSLIGDCGAERPAYYRVGPGPVNAAAIAGTIVSNPSMPVRGARVTLYVKGKGRIGSTTTDENGDFHFANVSIEPQEFWLSIEHDGFFLEEMRHLVVLAGL